MNQDERSMSECPDQYWSSLRDGRDLGKHEIASNISACTILGDQFKSVSETSVGACMHQKICLNGKYDTSVRIG